MRTRYIGGFIILIALLVFWGGLPLAGQVVAKKPVGPIYLLKLKASINPITQEYLSSNITKAQREGASLIIIQLDTPGGLLSSMKEIIDSMLASSVPVVVWIAPTGAWAASAGTFITMASDVAVMAQGTTIGAAHPVSIGGGVPGAPASEPSPSAPSQTGSVSAENPISQKIVNFSATYVRSLAEQKRKDPRAAAWAEQAVRRSVVLTANEALKMGVVDLLADNLAELRQKLNGYRTKDGRVINIENASLEEINMSWREQLLNYLADPNLTYILLLIGIYGLIYEFFSPGVGFGFAIGGISLLLAFMGLSVLPINLVGLGLILFGALLMVLDAFTPSHGVLTTMGVVSLLGGSFTLFNLPDSTIQLSIWNVVATVGTVTALSVFIIGKALLAQRRRPVTGLEGLVGAQGTVKQRLDPIGFILVNGEHWKAQTPEGQRLEAGRSVRVERVEGNKLIVQPADQE
ncbi:MAG TPA: nodulation protein NfeD [Candidatus Fraserbacteria bacterium]|nr:nodulation protein NfeD [Candidatus Fraserbacteria bacterium]